MKRKIYEDEIKDKNKVEKIQDIINITHPQHNYIQKKDEDEDYYHVDDSHITLYVYNFNTGCLEVLKERQFKESQMLKQFKIIEANIKKNGVNYISNKSGKEKGRDPNIISKKNISEKDKLDTYSEKEIKFKEIQKALTSKEKQSSIINLCIFSFVVFILIIGSSLGSLFVNIYLKGKAFTYYHLVEKSVTLYKDILFELFFVREMVLLANPLYNNTYDEKEIYFQNYSKTCYDYYLET